VALGDVAANCQLDSPTSVEATVGGFGSIAVVAFGVACLATTGSIDVGTVTVGVDGDLDGYAVLVDGAPIRSVADNGSAVVERLAPGDHSVGLGGVAAHCQVEGENPRVLRVSAGGVVQDTARTTFRVGCRRIWDLAYSHGGRLTLATPDGSVGVFLTNHLGSQPSFSPDGLRIAYSCSGSLCVIGTDGRGHASILHAASENERPAWHPSNDRIAFIRDDCSSWDFCGFLGLFLIGPTGAGESQVPLPSEVGWAADPAWSPDGTQLAFACWIGDGNGDICAIRPDGTGYRRLTTGRSVDRFPAWRPDGAALLFTSTRFGSGVPELALMGLDGSEVTRVSPTTGAAEPAWSRDGARIVFALVPCTASGCPPEGLFQINPNGSGLTRLTSGPDHWPAWRP
jgi:Tol biopolymer transport system component